MSRVKLEALGGPQAAEDFNAALNALHKFAVSSKCPPGDDVILWFDTKAAAYRDAMTAAIWADVEARR